MELPPLGIYKLHKQDVQSCILFPWHSPSEEFSNYLNDFKRVCDLNINVKYSIEPAWLLTEDCIEKVLYAGICLVLM